MTRAKAQKGKASTMADPITYIVDAMRITVPSAKARNPEGYAFTVKGSAFHSSTRDDKGKLVKGEELSFQSKGITPETARHPEFSLDMANGTVTVPNGRDGRPTAEGLTVDAVNALLASIQNPEVEVTADAAAPAEDAPTA